MIIKSYGHTDTVQVDPGWSGSESGVERTPRSDAIFRLSSSLLFFFFLSPVDNVLLGALFPSPRFPLLHAWFSVGWSVPCRACCWPRSPGSARRCSHWARWGAASCSSSSSLANCQPKRRPRHVAAPRLRERKAEPRTAHSRSLSRRRRWPMRRLAPAWLHRAGRRRCRALRHVRRSHVFTGSTKSSLG